MANYDLISLLGTTSKVLPSSAVDGTPKNVRVGQYGELIAQLLAGSKMHALVDDGWYFTSVNPTAGTGIIDTAALTGFVTTTPTMTVFNSQPTGGRSLYLDSFRLNVTAAGASGTNWAWAMYVDSGNRYTSGGSAITPANVNMGSGNVSAATINFGAITAPAAVSQRKIAASPGRTVIKVVGDEYLFKFGDASPISNGMPLEGTLQLSRIFQCPPVVVPPQCTFLFYEWGASQGTAAGFEFQLNHWER